jgi:predicted nucleic acid-binding protein
MARAVLDTNVILDFLDTARPEHSTAVALITTLVGSGTDLGVAATSLKDIYYILTRTVGEPAARQAITTLSQAMSVLAVDATTCADALSSDEPDFEDGLIRAAAEVWQANWIISRDHAAFAASPVPKAAPAVLLQESLDKDVRSPAPVEIQAMAARVQDYSDHPEIALPRPR